MAGIDGQAVSEGACGLSTGHTAWRRLGARFVAWRKRQPPWLPGICLLCGDTAGRDALCRPCLDDLPWLGDACPLCALPGDPRFPCGACQVRPPPWVGCRAALAYAFPVDRLVRSFKFHRQLAAGAALASAMVLAHQAGAAPRGKATGRLEPQSERGRGPGPAEPWLVPVPLHWTREGRRGFNQARELALCLSRATGWPVAHHFLRRHRRTIAQAGLGRLRRRRNLGGAFRWTGPDLAGRTLVLVDDVMTTGATAEACARAMAGADDVYVWVAARTPP